MLSYTINNILLWDAGFREHTFRGQWSDYNCITPAKLAKLGFYYSGPDNKVRCICCHLVYSNFSQSRNVYEAHRRDTPKCEFHKCTNIPGMNDFMLKNDIEYRKKTFGVSLYEWQSIDVQKYTDDGFYYLGPGQEIRCSFCQNTGRHDKSCQRNMLNKIDFRTNKPRFLSIREQGLMGILYHQADHPLMADEDLRACTVIITNKAPSDSKYKIAESGFYNNGKLLICFHCSANTIGWNPADDIDQFHRRTSLSCLFIRMKLDKSKLDTTHDNKTLAINGKTLKKVNRQQRYVCKVCYKTHVEIILIPCNHICCCKLCVESLQECPLCNQFIDGTITAFL